MQMRGGDRVALGVLSALPSADRRAALRSSWASAEALCESRVLLRFVLAQSSSDASGALAAEQQTYRDLFFLQDYLPHVADGDMYATKAFGWLHVALRMTTAHYIALADDDAYVNIAMVTSDLRLAQDRGLSRVAYGAVEWFAYELESGATHSWGFGEKTAAFAWRQRTARGRSAHGRPWATPFPFLKGPLMAFDRAVARDLSDGSHAIETRTTPPQVSNPSAPLNVYPDCESDVGGPPHFETCTGSTGAHPEQRSLWQGPRQPDDRQYDGRAQVWLCRVEAAHQHHILRPAVRASRSFWQKATHPLRRLRSQPIAAARPPAAHASPTAAAAQTAAAAPIELRTGTAGVGKPHSWRRQDGYVLEGVLLEWL
eukprot:6980031-Prymnesium_polylepis.1